MSAIAHSVCPLLDTMVYKRERSLWRRGEEEAGR
jgi:hypothetical protein